VEGGAEVNAKDTLNGGNSLFAAVEKGHAEVVKVLLENGTDFTLEIKGQTAMMRAKKKNYQEIVTLLQTAGAIR